MSVAEKDRILAALQTQGEKASVSDLRGYLRQVRELRLREPEPVAEYGSLLLRQHGRALGTEERYLVAEQTAIAAMDCNSFDLAFSLTNDLRRRFPKSKRASRLAAMYFEARGKYDRAEEIHVGVMLEAPDNMTMMKRQVAMEKTKGNNSAAIELLRKYLDLYQTDREAWEELADLYTQACMYSQAGHCYEEVLLHQPHNVAIHVQYADLLYTLGGPSNQRLAQTHYAAAIKLSQGANVRALFGVCACAAQLSNAKGSGSKSNEELASLTAFTLLQQYTQHAPGTKGLVQKLLAAQGIHTQ